MESLLQHVWSAFLRMSDDVVKGLEEGVDFQAFQQKLEDQLNELGRAVMRWVIEAVDERLHEAPEERAGWVVVRRGDRKEVLTRFGPVAYERTYFKHKKTGKHRYLADEQAGYAPHQRIDEGLKGKLVEQASERSYRRSGDWSEQAGWRVSGQTVMKAIRAMDPASPTPGMRRLPKERRRVPYLFIQADEDHVGSQEGAKWQPRLVTVYEGLQGPGWRKRLVNARHFGGLYAGKHEALWNEVWHYLDTTYDLEATAAILVSGDGAAWIRGGCEYLPGSVFVLDRYHAAKYVTQATGDRGTLRGRLWQALKAADRREMNRVFREALANAETQARREAIIQARRYLGRNWDGIVAWKTFEGVWPGCSAEGQVSHIYAARMSSRPMAWSETGADRMSRLRVMRANGESIQANYLLGREDRRRVPKLSERKMRELRHELRRSGSLAMMVHENVPALQHCLPGTRRILKELIWGR